MPGPPKALVVTAGLLSPERLNRLGVRASPLVPIANRPLVAHVLDGLRRAGVREAAAVGDGATRAEVASVVGDGDGELAIRYLDHVDRRAIDAAALVVQPADALLTTALDDTVGDIASARLDGAVMRVSAPSPRVGACLLGPEAADALDGTAAPSVDALADALVARTRRVRVAEVHGCL